MNSNSPNKAVTKKGRTTAPESLGHSGHSSSLLSLPPHIPRVAGLQPMFYNNTMLPMPMLPPMHSQYQQLLFQQQQNQLAMSQRLASMTESVSAEEVGMSTVVTPHGGATSTHNNTVDYGGGQKRVRSPSKHAHHVVLSSASNDGSSRKGFDPVVRAASLSALEAGKIARAKLKASMEGTSSLSNSTVAADDVGRAVVQRAEGGQPLLSPPPSPPDSPSRSGSFSSTSGDSSEWLDFVTSVETAAGQVMEDEDVLCPELIKIVMIWREFKDKHAVVDKCEIAFLQDSPFCCMEVHMTKNLTKDANGMLPSGAKEFVSTSNVHHTFNLSALMTMLRGSITTDEQAMVDSALEYLVASKLISRSDIKITNDMKIAEIDRRYSLLCSDESVLPEESTGKPPLPTRRGKSDILDIILSSTPCTDNSRLVQCPLKYVEEKRYLLCTLVEDIFVCVNEKRRLEFDKVIIPRNNTLLIMRLFEGTKVYF